MATNERACCGDAADRILVRTVVCILCWEDTWKGVDEGCEKLVLALPVGTSRCLVWELTTGGTLRGQQPGSDVLNSMGMRQSVECVVPTAGTDAVRGCCGCTELNGYWRKLVRGGYGWVN